MCPWLLHLEYFFMHCFVSYYDAFVNHVASTHPDCGKYYGLNQCEVGAWYVLYSDGTESEYISNNV